MTPVVILVLAALAVLFVVVVTLSRMGGHTRQRLRRSLEARGERMLVPPVPASYRGADGGRSKVKGNGIICLTARELVFMPMVGDEIGVPLEDIVAVREQRWFRHAAQARRRHLVVTLADGDRLGFYLKDQAAFLRLLAEAGVQVDPAAFGAGDTVVH